MSRENTIKRELLEERKRKGSLLIGSYINNPPLINELTLEGIEVDDDTAFYYGIMREMYNSKYRKFDNVSLETFVMSDPVINERYKQLGGYKALQSISEMAEEENAIGYYDRVLAVNLVLDAAESINLEAIYDKYWGSASANDLHNILEFLVTELDSGQSSSGEQGSIAVTEEVLDELDEGLALGVDYGDVLPGLNNATLGIPTGSLTLLGSTVGQGKSSLASEIIFQALEDGNKVGIVANEMDDMDYKILLLARLVRKLSKDKNYPLRNVAKGITRRTILAGNFNNDVREVLEDAAKITVEKYAPNLYFEKTYDYSTAPIIRTMRNWSKRGVSLIVMDVLKADFDSSNESWKDLIKLTRSLYQLASAEEIAILGVMQTALYSAEKRILDMTISANGKQMVEVASEAIFFRSMFDDEYEGENKEIKVLRERIDPDTREVMGEYEETIPYCPHTDYKIMFLVKTRRGRIGTSWLVANRGDQNEWEEIGRVRVLPD